MLRTLASSIYLGLIHSGFGRIWPGTCNPIEVKADNIIGRALRWDEKNQWEPKEYKKPGNLKAPQEDFLSVSQNRLCEWQKNPDKKESKSGSHNRIEGVAKHGGKY